MLLRMPRSFAFKWKHCDVRTREQNDLEQNGDSLATNQHSVTQVFVEFFDGQNMV